MDEQAIMAAATGKTIKRMFTPSEDHHCDGSADCVMIELTDGTILHVMSSEWITVSILEAETVR